MCIKQYDAFLKMFKALSVCVPWQSFEPVVVFLLSAYLMRLFLICVNVSEEHYFSSRSFTLASSYLKIIIEHLLCAINELAHGLCPQETASRKVQELLQQAHRHVKLEIHLLFLGVGKHWVAVCRMLVL